MIERRAFLMSLGLSVLAMYLVYLNISNKDAELKKAYGVFYPMVVTTHNILQYETIRPTDVEVVRVPQAMVPPGMISDPKDVIDAVAAIPISKGEQILDNKIISKNIYSGLDTQISIGKRAISLPVNVKSSVGYLLRPGNRVDLAAHFEYKASNTGISEVKVFLQDVLVLASGRTIQTDPPKGVDQGLIRNALPTIPKSQVPEVQDTLNYAKTDSMFQTVTLEVTPQQAQIITYVIAVFPDSITLLLRQTDDRQIAHEKTTNLYDVMGEESYYVRGNKIAPQKAIPRVKFYDYVGEQPSPVY
jgi:pilus assembly protein CpaB